MYNKHEEVKWQRKNCVCGTFDAFLLGFYVEGVWDAHGPS